MVRWMKKTLSVSPRLKLRRGFFLVYTEATILRVKLSHIYGVFFLLSYESVVHDFVSVWAVPLLYPFGKPSSCRGVIPYILSLHHYEIGQRNHEDEADNQYFDHGPKCHLLRSSNVRFCSVLCVVVWLNFPEACAWNIILTLQMGICDCIVKVHEAEYRHAHEVKF